MINDKYQVKRTSYGLVLQNRTSQSKIGYFKNTWEIIRFMKKMKQENLCPPNYFNVKINF